MNEKELRSAVERAVLCEFARRGESYVPVSSSNRHAHLSQADVERLFGAGYRLTKLRDLQQPGQFACNERVTIETEKGKLTLRVVGPARKETQVELSLTDAVKLGVSAPLRMSGELEGSPGFTLTNGENRVTVPKGVIVAARHLHLSPDEAAAYGVRNGDIVSLAVDGPRAATFHNFIVRSGESHVMEAHIDKDEANACGLTDGQLCRVIRGGGACGIAQAPTAAQRPQSAAPVASSTLQTYVAQAVGAHAAQAQPAQPQAAPQTKSKMLDLSYESRRLITEDDVLAAARDGYRLLRYAQDAIVTPLARDAAGSKGVELVTVV